MGQPLLLVSLGLQMLELCGVECVVGREGACFDAATAAVTLALYS